MKIIYYNYGIDKTTANKSNWNSSNYGGKIVDVDDQYADCVFEDFDNNGFNKNKYFNRKENEIKLIEENEIKQELDSLTKDFIQVLCGAVIPDFEQRKQTFKTKHNRLRELENKPPRQYN